MKMKARINPQSKLTKIQKEACDEYVYNAKRNELMRFLKICCVVLNRHFGMGQKRLSKFIAKINAEMEQHQRDPSLWVTIDRILIGELDLPFESEDYEQREDAMKATRR